MLPVAPIGVARRSKQSRPHSPTALADKPPVVPGAHPFTVERSGATLGSATDWIDAYRVRREILSTLQDAPWYAGATYGGIFGGLAVWTMPDGVGKTYWIGGESYTPWGRHSMTDVLAGLRDALKRQ